MVRILSALLSKAFEYFIRESHGAHASGDGDKPLNIWLKKNDLKTPQDLRGPTYLTIQPKE